MDMNDLSPEERQFLEIDDLKRNGEEKTPGGGAKSAGKKKTPKAGNGAASGGGRAGVAPRGGYDDGGYGDASDYYDAMASHAHVDVHDPSFSPLVPPGTALADGEDVVQRWYRNAIEYHILHQDAESNYRALGKYSEYGAYGLPVIAAVLGGFDEALISCIVTLVAVLINVVAFSLYTFNQRAIEHFNAAARWKLLSRKMEEFYEKAVLPKTSSDRKRILDAWRNEYQEVLSATPPIVAPS